MQQQPPRQRPGIASQATGPSPEAKSAGEEQMLESMLASLARNVLPQGAWEKVYETARAEERLSELAFAFDAVAQGKRLKATHPAAAAEFLFQAGRLAGDLGNPAGALAYLQRAMALAPAHAPTFAKLEELLKGSEQPLKLAELYAAAAPHRPRAEQPTLLRQATELLLAANGSDDRIVELLQQRLRLDAADEDAREALEPRLLKSGRFRDLIRLDEQALSADVAPDTRLKLLSRVVELYANKLQEPERALSHVEQLLAIEPTHEEARRVAHRLVATKGLAARAAAALANAYESLGSPEQVAHFLTIELESTRGAKRAALLVRLGKLKEGALNDPSGAFECFEGALALDAGDDDLRSQYVALALKLGRQAEAGRALTRLLGGLKEPAARARASVQLAQVLLRAGDVKRATSLSTEVMAAADAPTDAVLAAAHLLREIRRDDKDPRTLCEILERIATIEPNDERRREVDEQLAALATKSRDVPRAIGAYERLLTTSARPRALEALASLYEASDQPAKRALLLEERAKDTPDPAEARRLLLDAAEIYATGAANAPAAIAACTTVMRSYGAQRDVLQLLIPLLEGQGLWSELAEALSLEIAQTAAGEQAPLWSRLGIVRLQRLRDAKGAIAALEAAVSIDPGDDDARTILEKLAANGTHRIAAARVLEPLYRRDGSRAALLRVLDVRATLEPLSADRLAALREAADFAASGPGGADQNGSALDFAARGLTEATSSGQPIGEWLERLARAHADPSRRAAILAGAMGSRAVDSAELSTLAKETAEALVATGDLPSALGLFRRALAYEPNSTDLHARIDELLRDQGNPEERISLCRAGLEHASPARRSELLRRIGGIQRHDLRDLAAAIATFQTLLEEDAGDASAHAALEELYGATERWEALCDLLELDISQRDARGARGLRIKLIGLAAEHGYAARVREHGARVLDDADLDDDELEAVQTAADRVDEVEITRSVMRRRADGATTPAEAMKWLDRIASLELERRGDPASAAEAWKRAARLAESVGDDGAARSFYSRTRGLAPSDGAVTERLAALAEKAGDWARLPELYLALEGQSTNDAERVELALRTAHVLSERLGDAGAAARHAARALELAPHRSDILVAFERLGAAAGAVDVFERTIDHVLKREADTDRLDDEHRSALKLARARALANDRTRLDEAIAAYRSIVQDERMAESSRADALSALETLVAGDAGSPSRRADREWLLEWRAEHASGGERVARLLEWARAQETAFADPARALALYRRALGLAPDSDDALAAVARLSVDAEATEQALSAMRLRRDRAHGAMRTTMELQIARTLARARRWDEALQSVGAVLAERPGDDEAQALAAQALEDASTRDAAAQILERACERAGDPAARERILERLIAVDRAPGDLARRSRWSERLCDLQREAGRYSEALATAAAAARDAPEVAGLWDRAQNLAREVDRGAHEVGALYEEVLGRSLPRELAGVLGERAVQFCEEWFDDPGRTLRILDRVLELDPSADWAFDRIKLLLDSSERWDDLFALYDRVLASATGARREALLEDAAQTAKDFADRPDRAIGYLEQLRELRPSDPKLSSALERLYERQRKHSELVNLLDARLPGLEGEEARRTRIRIATLRLDELRDPGAALEIIEPMLAEAAGVTGATSSVWSLLERILGAVSEAVARWSTLPPLGGAEPRADGARAAAAPDRSVRLKAAAWLRGHYAAAGRDVDLARVLLIELEAVEDPRERARRHVQIADLYERVGDLGDAVDQTGCAVVLVPADDALRAKLVALAERMGHFDRLAEVLAGAAESAGDGGLRAALAMQAADVRAHRLGDASGAIALLLPILSSRGTPEQRTSALVAARTVEPLLAAAGRLDEQLDVVELIASLEPDEDGRRAAIGHAARLAVQLGHRGRALASWELRLTSDPRDPEALDGLVALLSVEGSNNRLAQVLELRAARAETPEARRADLVRVATLLGGALDRPSQSIEAWRAIDSEFGEADDAVSALATLFRRTERWKELSELLERGARRATDSAGKAERLGELGDVLRERLGEPERATAAYARTLDEDPANARARRGLEALTDDESTGPAALGVLLAALRRCDDWESILALTSKRVDVAESEADRVAVLIEAADLAEQRAGDVRRAFEATRQAFSIAPLDERVQRELARLAEASDSFPALVESYRRAVARLDDGPVCASMWTTIGATLELRLRDLDGALDAHLRVVSMAPDREPACAAVRVAGRLARWDRGARVVVDLALGSSSFAIDVLDAFERAAGEHDAWQAAASALTGIAASSGLRGSPARDIHARVAEWHRDRRQDPESAEESLRLALREDPSNVALLTALAASRRRKPDRLLVDTLIALSQSTGGSLAVLREATELARDALDDRDLTLRLARSVLQLAREQWGSPAGDDEGAPPAFAQWAIETIAKLHDDAGDARSMVDTLAVDDSLELAPDLKRNFRRRAARIAVDRLGDHQRAVELYLAIFEENPRDEEAVARLASIYSTPERRRDLLHLRERQIAASPDAGERVGLRLDAARLLTEIGETDRAVATLRESLADHPHDAASVEALATVLESAGRHSELRDLLVDQAAHATDTGQACDLWGRAARIAGDRLDDDGAAASYHEKVVALEPRAESFAALARLAERRAQPLEAAGWLEKWLEVVSRDQYADAALRLAEVLTTAREAKRAAACLERAITRTDDDRLRQRLATLYREDGQWFELAGVIADAAARCADPTARLARLLEAADLLSNRCDKAERAISLLRQAVEIAPEDHAIQLTLADVLAKAGQYDEARRIVQSKIDAFGGRRPKERASIHHQMARLELATGNRARALVELDAAARIDPQNPEILQRLGQLAQEDGQLERAEKSYRALLVVLRRRVEPTEPAIARGEVLLELSAIAARRGDAQRAREILESAIETASESDFDASRLEQAFRARGDYETLVRALEARLARESDGPGASKILAELADVLGDRLGRPEEALETRLRAIAVDPRSSSAHDAAIALARSIGRVDRYADSSAAHVEKAIAIGDKDLARTLLFRLGALAEADLGDCARAAGLYERALELEPSSGDILAALDRVYERLGDVDARARVLTSRIDLATRGGEPRAASDALYRLAALRLASRESFGDGAEKMKLALDVDPQFERAERTLRAAIAIDPTDTRVLDLYERVGRQPGFERTLVDALRLRAMLPGASPDAAREAVEAALRFGDRTFAESILARFTETEATAERASPHLTWAIATLATLREEAGDLRGALALKVRAAEMSDPSDSRRLRLEVARIAADELGDLNLAADTYATLRRADRTDREAWEALAAVYRRQDDPEKLATLLESVIEDLDDGAERAKLRLERVRCMQRLGAGDPQVAPILRDALDEEPGQIEAALLLAQILERSGARDELTELLSRQIDAAKDRADAASISSLALRLGKLVCESDRTGARNLYYTGLDWEPTHKELLDALLGLLEDDDSAGERADVLERRLALEKGPEAEAMALALWKARNDAGDDDAAERALVVGYAAHPGSEALPGLLEETYRQRGDWRRLAELFVTEARARSDAQARISRLRDAAAIYSGELDDPKGAADAIGLARQQAPSDTPLLLDHVKLLVSAGELEAALAELDRALEAADDGRRSPLLASRAGVKAALGDAAGQVQDLDLAFAIDPEAHAATLAVELDRARARAEEAADEAGARRVLLRLARVLPFAGDADRARGALQTVLTHDPADREAWRIQAGLESSMDRWEAASEAWARLVALEEGDAAVDATVSLAEACERAGKPAEARGALERALAGAKSNRIIRERLEHVYEATGAWHELAGLELDDAREADDSEQRCGHLLRAGWLLLTSANDAAGAIPPIEEAVALRPNDLDAVALLSDAYIAAGRASDAAARLEQLVTPHRGRRARELAPLHLRLARAAHELSDAGAEALSLVRALECDAQNGDVCSEVAVRAFDLGQMDLATRALRAVTLLKSPGPMTKAVAYHYMGEIARQQGDPKRAVALLRRAISEDPELKEARSLLEFIEHEQ